MTTALERLGLDSSKEYRLKELWSGIESTAKTKDVYKRQQMMWLLRSWKMNNQIYGLEQIVDWLDLDVYKRQVMICPLSVSLCIIN